MSVRRQVWSKQCARWRFLIKKTASYQKSTNEYQKGCLGVHYVFNELSKPFYAQIRKAKQKQILYTKPFHSVSDDEICSTFIIDINDFDDCKFNQICIDSLKSEIQKCTSWIHKPDETKLFSIPMEFGLHCEYKWAVVLFITNYQIYYGLILVSIVK